MNQSKWLNSDVNSYIISLVDSGLSYDDRWLGDGTTLTINDGQVVKVSSTVCTSCNAEDYQRFAVESLFDAAKQCIYYIGCQVDYDAQYGFPRKVFYTLIEGSGVLVTDFVVLNEPRANR